MKKILSLLAIVFIPFLMLAQKVDISKNGIVSVNGKDEFKIEGKMGVVNTTFSVYNLDGDLLISADGRNENNFMTVTFSGNNSSLDYPLTIGLKKIFTKDIVKMQVIKDGQLNPDGLKRFVAKYNGRADRDMLLTDNNTRNNIQVELRPVPVQRDRNGLLFISGKKIKQDNVVIGEVTSSQDVSKGKVIDYFVIKDADGNFVANVSKEMSSKEIEFIIYDNRKFTVYAERSNINTISLKEMVVQELIDRGIL